jgi:integrase
MKVRVKMMPPRVNRVRGRDGVNRYYHRVRGFPNVKLCDIGDPGFAAEYAAAEARVGGHSLTIGAKRQRPGSIDAVIADYLRSTAFECSRRKKGKGRAETTKYKERNSLARFAELTSPNGHRLGDQLLIHVRREHVQAILDTLKETPATARDIHKALGALCRFARLGGVIKDDPTNDVIPPPTVNESHPQWSEEHIAAFKARHPVGTKARLALTLLLWTGQRLGDVAKMGRQHLRQGPDGMQVIDLRQGKTGTEVPIPVMAAELREAIAAIPPGQLTFLVTQYGAPFTALGNHMTEWCREAGLPPGHGAHGLRYAFCCRMADAGVQSRDIAAISGHLTQSMVEKYTARRDKEAGAIRAMTKLVEFEAARERKEVAGLQT